MGSNSKVVSALFLVVGVVAFSVVGVPQMALPRPTLPASPTTAATQQSYYDTFNSEQNTLKNQLCETNPTHLICNSTVAYGHKIEQNLPPSLVLRHCNVFIPSPHCCGQFCGTGGTCDQTSGACFCKPAGLPNVCQLLMRSDNTSTAGMNDNDFALLDLCRTKCANNPNGCTNAAAATDGIVGSVCFCYC